MRGLRITFAGVALALALNGTPDASGRNSSVVEAQLAAAPAPNGCFDAPPPPVTRRRPRVEPGCTEAP